MLKGGLKGWLKGRLKGGLKLRYLRRGGGKGGDLRRGLKGGLSPLRRSRAQPRSLACIDRARRKTTAKCFRKLQTAENRPAAQPK